MTLNGYLVGLIATTTAYCGLDDPKPATLIFPYISWIMDMLKKANNGEPWPVV
jgi:hypothetical protein